MRDILGLSAGVIVALVAMIFHPFTFLWYFTLFIAALLFLYSAAHILFARAPLWSSIPFKSLYKHRILIEDAARIAYEKAERLSALEFVDSPNVAPENKLNHFKYAFMTNNEITLYGTKPPSSMSLPIPREELSELYPVPGLSQLNYLTPYQQIAYIDVAISRKDLRHIIRQYIPKVHRFVEQLKRR
jgi:hypothetical protein